MLARIRLRSTTAASPRSVLADPRPAADSMMAREPGLLFDPATGAAITPRLLHGVRGAPPDGASHQELVAWFALEGGRHLTYRNLANRVFAALFGRGLVEATDDHRLSNPAADERLLGVLAQLLEQAEGDLGAFLVEHR